MRRTRWRRAKDPLNQHQYGFTFGGPMVRDRTFWFGNVERTQQDRTGIVTIAPASVTAVNAALDAAGYRGPRIATGNFPTGYTGTNAFVRVDHQAASGPRLQVRYSVYNVTSANARNVGGLSDVSRGTALDDTDHTAAVSYLTTFSSGMINEARAQYTRSRLGAPANDIVGPAVAISGVANFGTSTSSPTGRDIDVVQAVDTLTMPARRSSAEGGRRPALQPGRHHVPGRAAGQLHVHVARELPARRLLSSTSRRSAQPSLLQSNPNLGAVRAGRVAAAATT